MRYSAIQFRKMHYTPLTLREPYVYINRTSPFL